MHGFKLIIFFIVLAESSGCTNDNAAVGNGLNTMLGAFQKSDSRLLSIISKLIVSVV